MGTIFKRKRSNTIDFLIYFNYHWGLELKWCRAANILKTASFDDYMRHYVKSVQIRGFYGPYFPVFGLNTGIFSPNTGKYGPEKTLYLDTFHAARVWTTNFLHSEIENCISCKRLIVQTIVRSLENVILKKSRAGYLLRVIFLLVQKSLRVASLAFHFLSFTALFLDGLVLFLFMNRYPWRSV